MLTRGLAALVGLWCVGAPLGAQSALYRSEAFVVTDTSVRQGPFEAIARAPDTLVSTYPRAAQEVIFKFSINGTENEFPPGEDHLVYLRAEDGEIVSPVYTFGRLEPPRTPTPSSAMTSEEGTARVTFRLDMRHVLAAFREQGWYDPPNGPPIAAEEFEGVYIMGNTEPLSWDMSTLRPGARSELRDADGDGIYQVTLPFEAEYTRPLDDEGRAIWARSADLSRFPTYRSSERLVDALYRLSLEELVSLIREDGGIVGGARWPAVWTRDLAWVTILAAAPLVPEAVRTSLLLKTDSLGRIIQDTGTGGSWPVSTDRMAWSLAAWELWAVTGDRGWLRTAYDIIRRSAEADLATAFDPVTGLFRGESSFLDWREQSYPGWMDPKDIYLSQTLGTNGLHFGTYRVLGRMARELGEPAERWDQVAERVRRGMNEHLWQPERGYYGQYLYGRNHLVLSPRAEGLGEAFTILFGVADPERRAELARRMPVVPFGVPSFWPYIPEQPPYHNAGIWPQVVGFWTWAAAEAGHTAGVEHGLASLFRAGALFLTNKENMVAATGHFEGTELNSDRLVGSVGAMLGAVYRVLLGVRVHADHMAFEPFVPRGYNGERTLDGLRYRDAVLTVTVRGFGSGVARVLLDGRPVPRAEVPATLTGEHTIDITLDGELPESSLNMVENLYSPATPVATARERTLSWEPVPDAVDYVVHANGLPVLITTATSAALPATTDTTPDPDRLTVYQAQARDGRGLMSFLSDPVRVRGEAEEWLVQPPAGTLERRHDGFTGGGYVPLTIDRNRSLRIPVEVPADGLYAIDVRYANGSGPINSGSSAAIRSLMVDGSRKGALVMPHRGADLWTDWGYSSPVRVALTAGRHLLTLALTDTDRNMDMEVNDALLDHVRLTRLEDAGPSAEARAARAARTDPEAVAFVDSIIQRMTLEEKLGQLTLNVGRWTDVGPRAPERGEEEIRAGRLGTLYGVYGADYTRRLQRVAVEESRLGIPMFFAHDVLHGFRTLFPMPLAQAASWNPALVERAARIAALEASGHGLHWTFGPMVDIARDPRWGRIVEGAGEDPYLGSAMAVAQVRGFQGGDLADPGTVLATAKHYVAYGAAEAGRDYNTVDISERTLHEVYLPPFRAAVAAGVASVMPAFNEISGIPMHAHGPLINGLLREHWDWDGVVVSDYTGVMELLRHGVAATPAEAGILALRSGVDIDIVSDIYLTLAEEVEAGRLPEAEVDRAVRRVLLAKHAAGLFDDPYRYSDAEREASVTLTAEHRSTARELARESIVLLKNQDGLLPLSKELGTIAVVGPLAADRTAVMGTWTAAGREEDAVSVLAGIRDAVSAGTEVVYAPGLPDAVSDDGSGIDEAAAAAAAADAVILVIGEPEHMTAEAASRAFLDIPGRQLELARAVLDTGTPTAVVLMNGRPVGLDGLEERASAILEAWYLGLEMGPAVADVVFGDYNPAGRLPVTFPRNVGQIPLHYAHKTTGRPPDAEERYTSKYLDAPWTPLFPFGHGLSYTSFSYSELSLGAKRIGATEPIDVTVTVTNTGERAGDEVVQLYIRDEVGRVTRPVRELRGFRRIHLEPGVSESLTFTLHPRDLAYPDAEMQPAVEPGAFTVYVGSSSDGGMEARFEVMDTAG